MSVTTISQQIESIIGTWVPSEYPELYKDAFNAVADIIPLDSELWANANLTSTASVGDITNTGENSYKIVRVVRDNRPAKEISYNDYLQGLDTKSIYYNAENHLHPVYTRLPDGTVAIVPSAGTVAVYYWQYTNTTDFDTVASDVLSATLNGFPDEARLLAVIKAGINILYTKISDAVQEEEDSELMQMIQAQMQQLQQWFQGEMQRLNIPDKVIGVEKGNLK